MAPQEQPATGDGKERHPERSDASLRMTLPSLGTIAIPRCARNDNPVYLEPEDPSLRSG